MPGMPPFVVWLVVAAGLALWNHRFALAVERRVGAVPFFATAQRAGWISGLAFMSWLMITIPGVMRMLMQRGIPDSHAPSLGLLAVVAPPVVFVALNGLLVQAVARRARMTAWSAREALEDAITLVVGALCPTALIGLAIEATRAYRLRAALLLAVTAIAVTLVLALRRHRLHGLLPHAVMSGELRDRVFALAALAGVKLQQLHVVPLRSFRIANAFAVQGDRVMLTDVLLGALSREEVDAVLAHEMAHLKRRDPDRLQRVMVIGITALVMAPMLLRDLVPGWVWIAAPIGGFFALLAHHRAMEYATDAEAVKLGADPRALILGLVRLGQLAQMPVRWSRWLELALTHPSTERRAMRLVASYRLDAGAMRAALDAPPPLGPCYEMPAVLDERRAFGPAFKRGLMQRISLGLLLAPPLAATTVVAVAGWLDPVARPIGFVAATIAAWLAFQWVAHAIVPRSLARLGDPAERRVGLSPSHTYRLFDELSIWDLGCVRLEQDRLVYRGEETSFALTREHVREVWFERGPGWIPTGVLRVRWEGSEGAGGIFGLDPIAGVGGRLGGRAARALLAEIEAWRGGSTDVVPPPADATSNTAASAHAAPLGDPPRFAVTSQPLRAALEPRRLAMTWLLLLIAAVSLAALIGLTPLPTRPGWLDLIAALTLAYALHVAPLAAWRETAAPEAPASDAARRAA